MIVKEYDFLTMRKLLADYGIGAPESDADLGNNWNSYMKKLNRKMKEVKSD